MGNTTGYQQQEGETEEEAMRINNIMRQWRNKLPRPPLLPLWSADDLSAFLSGLDLAYPSAVASSVTWQETDGPRALAALAKSKQSLFQLLQLKDKQSQDGEEIVRALQTKLEESRLLDEEFQGKWAEYWASGDQIGLERLEDKMKGCLWGMYIGDALSMPVHWSYDVSAMKRTYGRIKDYMPAPDTVDNTIMYKHWNTNNSHSKDVIGKVINHDTAHMWKQPYTHYHAGMKAGENTLDLRLARVLGRSVIKERGYNAAAYLRDFAEFMTTPGSHNDVYADAFLRQFFYNHKVLGKELEDSAGEMNHDTASGAGLVSVPLVTVASLAQPVSASNELVSKHVMLTHRSDRLVRFGTLYSSLLSALLLHDDRGVAKRAMELAGQEMGVDLAELVSHKLSDTVVLGSMFSIACYIADGMPSLVYLVYKYLDQSPDDFEGCFEETVLANTNCGGENCHRGALVGALVGATTGASKIPARLIEGLHARDELEKEINEFVDIALASIKSQRAHRAAASL